MEFIARTIGNAAGLWLAVTLLSGISVPGAPTTLLMIVNLLVVGMILALVNSLVKPVARFLTFPLYIITFGLFALVVNGLMLLLTSRITDGLVGVGAEAGVALGLHVGGFGSAIVGSIIVSFVSAIIVGVIGPKEE